MYLQRVLIKKSSRDVAVFIVNVCEQTEALVARFLIANDKEILQPLSCKFGKHLHRGT